MQISIVHHLLLAFFDLLLDFKILHVKKPEDQSEDIWRAANPRLDINVEEIIVPFYKVPQMGNLQDLVVNNTVNVKEKTNANHAQQSTIASFTVNSVEVNEKKRGNEDLHVILKIPAPSHTHFLTVSNEVVHEQQCLPGTLAVRYLSKSHVFLPNRPAACVNVHRVINQNSHDVRGPKSENSVNDSHRVLQDAF